MINSTKNSRDIGESIINTRMNKKQFVTKLEFSMKFDHFSTEKAKKLVHE